MSKCCAIPGCRSKNRNSVTFSVAQNNSLAQWWTTTPWYDEAKDATISRDLKICSLHFNEDQLDRSHPENPRLMRNVVPSINLPGSFSIVAVQGNYKEPIQQPADCGDLLMSYCRFCGKKQKNPLKNHLEDLVESEDLLQLCLGRGRFLEGFPNGVCQHCLKVLQVTTSFLKNCEQAQEKLQKLFFGTSQQMVDSMVEEEQYIPDVGDSFVMPEAIVSLKEEESLGDSDGEAEFLEMGSQDDPLDEEEGEYLEAMYNEAAVQAPPPKRKKAKNAKAEAGGGGGEQEDIRCTICDRRFNRKRNYNAHMESIHEGRIFTCPICGKSMGWRKTLQRHMKSHEENFQKHKCEECGKAFSRPSHLRLHMNSHTGQKVRCSLCNKGYRDSYKLGDHLMKTHSMDPESAKTYAQQAQVW